MKIPEQVTRLGLVITIVIVIVLALRFVFLPAASFSARPHQAATVEREMAKPLHHAGVAPCRQCHEEQFELKYAGFHRNISCETCHGPALAHASDVDAATPPLPRDREFCLACHAYDASRPNGFPQVDPLTHNPRKRCVVCHDPHDPVPPQTPADCAGCHGSIERTKALSVHALLPCSQCHTVDEQHFIEPRAALPSKPDSREACGRCHAAGSTDPATSKFVIDIDSHGGTYVCWQCHYAHLPEGRQ